MATKVCIMGLDKDSKTEVLVTCELKEDGTVGMTGNEYIIKNLTKYGAESAPLERMAYPDDGQAFLDALPGNFKLHFLTAVPC
jgi:hypothetical protein